MRCWIVICVVIHLCCAVAIGLTMDRCKLAQMLREDFKLKEEEIDDCE
jgi:hypothetical protein